MDNTGANANDLDGVYFQNKTEGRGYYDHGGANGGKSRKIVLSHAFGDARRIGSCAARELGHAFDHCVSGLQKKSSIFTSPLPPSLTASDPSLSGWIRRIRGPKSIGPPDLFSTSLGIIR